MRQYSLNLKRITVSSGEIESLTQRSANMNINLLKFSINSSTEFCQREHNNKLVPKEISSRGLKNGST